MSVKLTSADLWCAALVGGIADEGVSAFAKTSTGKVITSHVDGVGARVSDVVEGASESSQLLKVDLQLFASKGTSELVGVTAGKTFKSHFLDHKKLLEKVLGTKYPKLKADGPRFLDDIGKCINEGIVEYVYDATLFKGSEVYKVYRGNGITISTKLNGEWHTLIESGKGLDLKWLPVN